MEVKVSCDTVRYGRVIEETDGGVVTASRSKRNMGVEEKVVLLRKWSMDGEERNLAVSRKKG